MRIRHACRLLRLLIPLAVAGSWPQAAAARGRPRHAQHGIASFYGQREAGRKTASGAPLRPGAMTAASPTLPLGSRAKVTNEDTGRSAEVTITDRGPNTKGRVLDVTPKAAQQLGITKDDGVAPVTVQPQPAPADPHR